MSKQTIYAIYEDNIFVEKYALTSYEARKYCVKRARAKLKEKDENAKQLIEKESNPLWFGLTPETPGYWLVYGFPGPIDNLIHVINFTRGWFSTSFTSTIEFSICYKTIERVDIISTVSPPKEIVKSEVRGVKKVRNILDPHDNVLFNIERGVTLRNNTK